MSNQRAGKTHKAAASDGLGDMHLLQSIKALKEATLDYDEFEWLFDIMIEELREGRRWPTNSADWGRVLGL
jgi:hypothetical protein